MKVIAAISAVALTAWLAWWAYVQAYGTDTIEYRGQQFQLTKEYADYESYLSDPKNIAPSELPRIRKLMQEQPVARTYESHAALVDQFFRIKFPGYGLGGMEVESSSGRFFAESIEIPPGDSDRILVLQEVPAGQFKLVDDFIAPDGITSLKLEGSRLSYRIRGQEVVRDIASEAQGTSDSH